MIKRDKIGAMPLLKGTPLEKELITICSTPNNNINDNDNINC